MPDDPRPDPHLGGLILRFVALLVVLDLWAVHHFGVGVRNLVVPAGIATALAAAVKVAGFIWDEETVRNRLREVVKPVRPLLARLVTRGTVGVLAALTLVLLVSVSSVAVVDSAGAGAAVALSAIEEPADARERSVAPGGSTRYPVLTTPFGRLVRIDAAGFVGGTFTVYPPIGLRVQLGRDLPALPSVLFRPSPEALSYLADGAVFRVVRATPEGERVLAADTGYGGSFLLGRPRAISSGMVEDWTRALQATGAPAAAVAGVVNAWKQPRRLQPAGPLAAGELLRAEVRAGDLLIAATEIGLDGVELIDVVVEGAR